MKCNDERDGIDPDRIDHRKYYRIYKVLRFCESIEGFHTGNLDLTGRHLPRYESLSRRWNAFLRDFINLSLSVETHWTEMEIGRTRIHKYVEYTLTNNDEWDNFVKIWRVSHSAGYGGLIEPVRHTLHHLSLNPLPKFQKLCLLDLPVEILDHIFSFAAVEKARLLSSVCQKLREIGKPYIFITRTLKLDLPSGFWKNVVGKDVEETNQLMLETIEACKTDLIKQAKFLLGRHDLTNVVGTLWLGNPAMQTMIRFGVNTLLGDTFYEPIFKAFKNVLLNCRNLRNLTLSKADISVDILQAVVSLRQLIVLDFRACTIPQTVIQSVLSGKIIPTPSVLNLVLLEGESPTFNIWASVALCPNLRTLSVLNFSSASDTLEPSILVSRRSKVFTSLERLYVGPVGNAGVIDLTRWIELNVAEAPLKLTHLKISAVTGLDDRFLFQLLDALESAPLQILVLDGIKEGSFELFDRIAAKCPNLMGLTVFRRENTRQRQTKLATWPHASYEYASHFSAFQCLRHFSWNFRVEFFEQTPASMRYFEEGYISEVEIYKRLVSGEDSRDDDYFMDGYYVAYPFAAHCQTLKSFAVISGKGMDNFCYIKRKDNQQFQW
ncbi:hypothetical protein BDQ17DRAFT_1360991 [Cyathus striatus]|nr:hypothetical protein BDQ17DRAFT_1360991 [Cyathus striatus]